MARDPRKPVLDLRPVKMDEHEFVAREGWKGEERRQRVEPLLLQPFEIFGPLVGIGRPEENRPPWEAGHGSMSGMIGREAFVDARCGFDSARFCCPLD
jgi:hypothetical protein